MHMKEILLTEKEMVFLVLEFRGTNNPVQNNLNTDNQEPFQENTFLRNSTKIFHRALENILYSVRHMGFSSFHSYQPYFNKYTSHNQV